GGVISGNGAEGHTSDDSAASATLGQTSHTLYSGDFTVGSWNLAQYSSHADSTNASVVGAAGAFATFTGGSSATTTLPSSLTIVATGVVEIKAESDVVEEPGSNVQAPDDNVNAAGGGGISLTAAESSSDITSHSTVSIGNNFHVSTSNVPESSLGRIGIDAGSSLLATDLVNLETGGAIDGAGVDSELTGHLYTTVTIGTGAILTSSENVGVGTWTIVDGQIEADESTWGLAAVGSADAHTNIDTHESIDIGTGSRFTALGDVDIRTGTSSDDGEEDSLIASSRAEGYIRGLIAVPDASGSTHITTDQETTIEGITIISGRDTQLGADPYNPIATADGTGRGYELGFIPVTDGSSDPQVHSTANVSFNGSVEAGYYYNLTITIDNGQNAPGGYFTDATCNSDGCSPYFHQNSQSIPVTATYDPSFNPIAFLTASNLSDQERQLLIDAVQSGTVGAIHLSDLWAAAGNIVVDAKTASGTASFIAHGKPSITVINNSRDYLVLDGTTVIPYGSGGRIVFEGGASQFGNASSPQGVDQQGTVTIQNESNDTYKGSTGTGTKTGAGIAIGGEISNLSGHVELDTNQGSVLAIQPIYADSISIYAPNGAVIENLCDASGYCGSTVLGTAPMSEFQGYIFYPGGSPITATTITDLNNNADQAIAVVANSEHSGFSSSGDLMQYLLGHPDNGNITTGTVYIGDCLPAIAGDCGQQGAQNDSPIGSAWQYTGDPNSWYPSLPVLGTDGLPSSLTITSNDYSCGSGCPSTLGNPFGGPVSNGIVAGSSVVIHAGVIDMDTHVTVGPPTNWSASIPQNLLVNAYVNGILLPVNLAAYRSLWQQGRIASATVTLPVQLLNTGDSPINAVYDASTNTITLDPVRAAGGAGVVIMDGKIVNTNNLGSITVNAGLGQVEIDNETNATLAAQDIYAGSLPQDPTAATSAIDMIDRQTNVQTLYTYRAGVGTREYQSSNLSATIAQMETLSPVSSSTGSTATYDPEPGLRFEWQMEATLSRTVDPESGAASNWTFNVGTTSPVDTRNPWLYYNYADGQYESADLPDATYVYDPADENTTFIEQINGFSTNWVNDGRCYTGYSGMQNNTTLGASCQLNSGDDPNKGTSLRLFNYITDVTLQLTVSVKADNPIPIQFAGLSRGLISIISKGDVLLEGDLTNSSGDTTIQAAGKITQAQGTSINSNTLELDATGGPVGSSGHPIQATISNNGTLGGTSSSAGFWITLTGGAAIKSITAGTSSGYGDVGIIAGDDLTHSSGSGTNITARNLTISYTSQDGSTTSTVGGVGALGNPLVIALHTTPLGNGGFADGVLRITAPDTIAIEQVGGDLVIDQVVSTNGDVWVDVTNGGIYDVRGQTPAQTISDDAASALWARMRLTDDLGAGTLEQQTVTAYDNQVDRNYFQYWQLLGEGSVSGGTYSLDTGKEGLYTLQAQAAAAACVQQLALNPSATCSTSTDVQTYVNGVYHTLVTNLDDELGALPSSENTSFTFTLDTNSQRYADLTKNAVWTDKELRVALDRVALGAGGGPPTSAVTTVSGKDVTLLASGSIGKPTGSVDVLMSDLTDPNVTLTDEQVGAITTAVAPGSITIYAYIDGSTTLQAFNLSQLPPDCAAPGPPPNCHTIDIYEFAVAENAPIFVSTQTGGTLDVEAGGSAYVNTTGSNDILLKRFSAGATGVLTAPQSIIGTGSPTETVSTGGDFTVSALGGSLTGPSGGPLVIHVGGILRAATAGAAISLREDTGNLTFDRIAAGTTVSVTVSGGSLIQHGTVTGIIGTNLTLSASSAIGTSGQFVIGQIDPNGTVSATAGGSIYYDAVNDLHVLLVQSTSGDVSLTADSSILDQALADNASDIRGNTVTLIANNGGIGALGNELNVDSRRNGVGTLNAAAAMDIYLIEASGDMVLGTVGTPTNAYLEAYSGNITNGLGSGANVTADSAWLSASNSIGTSKAVTTAVSNLVGHAGNGQIWIDNTGALYVGDVATIKGGTPAYGLDATGAITVDAHSPITIGADVNGGGNVTFTSADDTGNDAITLQASKNVTSGGSISLLSGDGIVLESASSLDAAVDVILTSDYNGDSSHDPITITDATINAGRDIVATATGDVTITGSTLTAGRDLTVTAGDSIDATDSTLTATTRNVALTANGGTVTLTDATVYGGVDVTITGSGDVVIQTGPPQTQLTAGRDVSITAGGALTVTGSTISAGRDIHLTADGGDVTESASTNTAGGNAVIQAADDVTLHDTAVTAGDLASFTAIAGSFLGDTGTNVGALSILIQAGANVHLTSTTTLGARDSIDIYGDYMNAAPAGNTTILLEGTMQGRAPPEAPTINVYGNSGPDVITLRPVFVYGQVYIWGSNAATAPDTYFAGTDAGDLITIDQMPTLDLARKYLDSSGSPASLVTTGFSGSDIVRFTVNVDGQGGGDSYVVNETGSSDYIVNVHDTGAPADGVDTLTINGMPDQSNVFLLRANFVALMQPADSDPSDGNYLATYERVNYDDSINMLLVNGGTANDYFYVDDNSAITVLDGGPGNDSFQFGQMFGTDRTQPNVAPGDQIATVLTTVGYLSRGISYATTAYGGDDADTFTVYSNKADLKLFGENGNDTFIVRAFVIVGTNTVATNNTLVNGGAGDDHIEYNINAPVAIDGGNGFDTVVVIGTEENDNFVITKDGVMGAGLNVSYTNVEKVEVDGLGGNDNFYVLSTDPNVITVLDGGQGSDTFNVAGDVTGTVVAYNGDGTSAFINHDVSSTDPAYDGIFA
ncbi:MAG: beta strand repeat-containing protein, partial [Gaiellaceae bacterium]